MFKNKKLSINKKNSMKNNYFIITIILIFTTLLFSCTDDLPKGELIITVQNNSSPVQAADVFLYISEQRMLNEAKINDGWQITDLEGKVHFKKIAAQKYWIYCKFKDDSGNEIKLTDSVTVYVDNISEIILD